jgi:predicted peroxiredoxin/TusA-related sulfurtransferase
MAKSIITSIIVTVIMITGLFTGCATTKMDKEVLPMGRINADVSIDMRGKTITTYIVFHAAEKLQDMKEGEVLEIVTDNFEAIESDIRAWCRLTGHGFLETETDINYQRYYIRKAGPVQNDKSLAMVISNPGLLELLSPLGFALGAALGGTDVYIYFQGPAVRVLKKGYKAKLGGLGRPFSGFARKGLAQAGHITPQDKLDQLKMLGAKIYACGPSMQRFKVSKNEFIYEDVIVSEYLTFIEIIKKAEVQIILN